MPIYEFSCRSCRTVFELLFKNDREQVRMICPDCGSGELERILSPTRGARRPDAEAGPAAGSKTRTCAGGSCVTYDIPGIK